MNGWMHSVLALAAAFTLVSPSAVAAERLNTLTLTDICESSRLEDSSALGSSWPPPGTISSVLPKVLKSLSVNEGGFSSNGGMIIRSNCISIPIKPFAWQWLVAGHASHLTIEDTPPMSLCAKCQLHDSRMEAWVGSTNLDVNPVEQ